MGVSYIENKPVVGFQMEVADFEMSFRVSSDISTYPIKTRYHSYHNVQTKYL